MRRCIIHIGHPKTASTYLQHCLHLNAGLFASHNIWLPAEFTPLGFYDLAAMSERGEVISGNLAPLHDLMCVGPGGMVPRMHDYLFAPPGMGEHCDVLLSSELFFYYVRALAQVVKAARLYGLAPEIIAFVQRQDRSAITSYLQNVRLHNFAGGVVDFLVHDQNMPYCRYMQTLQRLLTLEPDVPITLRSFDSRFMAGGDILTDFLTATGAPFGPDICRRPAVASNQGLLLEHYELLRAATILQRDEASAWLRVAQATLTGEERARITAFYYRPAVKSFLEQHYLPDNIAMVARFMPHAGAAEQAHWEEFDPVAKQQAAVNIELLDAIGDAAFNG